MVAGTFVHREFNDIEYYYNGTDVPAVVVICVLHILTDKHPLVENVTIPEAVEFCEFMENWEYWLELISLLFGLPGNIMAAVTSLSMETGTSSIYLFFLAIGDHFTLIIRAASPTTTRVAFEIIKRMLGFFPNSILTIICLERFMAVCYPWKKKRWFTKRLAYYSIWALGALLWFFTIMVIIIEQNTNITEGGLNTLIAFLQVGLPCPFIVAFNVMTVMKLRASVRSTSGVMVNSKFWSQVEASITYMMIITSFAFFLLNMPSLIAYITAAAFESYTGAPIMKRTTLTFILNVTYWITYIHHCGNFYLYVLGTKRFRMQCLLLLNRFNRATSKKTDYKNVKVFNIANTMNAVVNTPKEHTSQNSTSGDGNTVTQGSSSRQT